MPSYFCQQQKILAYINAFYTFSPIWDPLWIKQRNDCYPPPLPCPQHHKYTLRHGVGINDIALLFLKDNFTFNPYVQPATFTLDDVPREGERCEVAGWGRTNGVYILCSV